MLKILLACGADVNARTAQGRSALHMMFETFKRGKGLLPDFQEALICLINAGADVFAVDKAGYSVSALACYPKVRSLIDPWTRLTQPFNENPELRTEWVHALEACGYDAEEVIAASVNEEELSHDKDFLQEYFKWMFDDCDSPTDRGWSVTDEEVASTSSELSDPAREREQATESDTDSVVSGVQAWNEDFGLASRTEQFVSSEETAESIRQVDMELFEQPWADS